MKKILIFILSLIVLSGLFVCPLTAVAAEEPEAPTTLDADDLQLLLPERYEQYLSLQTVSGISIKRGYIAVASADTLYIFNGQEYLTYQHSTNIAQLEFDDLLRLYFLDNNGNLYTMDCTQDTLMPEDEGISCSSFTLADDTLYYAMSVTGTTNIYNKNNRNNPIATLSAAVTTVPSMAYQNGKLYYTDGQYLIIYENGLRDILSLTDSVYDISVQGNILYYTDKQKLYAYDLTSERIRTEYAMEGRTYELLCLDANDLYVTATVGASTRIFRFDTLQEGFTDYEIAAASDSQNRLVAATQSIVNGNFLITADQNRISLYNYKEKSFSDFSCAFTPEFLASDGESILIANASTVCAYGYDGSLLTASPITNFHGNIVGVACAKGGDYLLITRNISCYRINATDFTVSAQYTKDMITTARSMCGDIYGNVYVEYSDNTVYKYTEEQFLSAGMGTLYYTFPSAVEHLEADFDGNIYGIAGNTLFCSNGKRYVIDSSDCLFNAPSVLQDFAFGFEQKTVYFIYEDYVLSTDAIDLPNLNHLETDNSYQTVFESNQHQSDVVSVVTLNQNAMLLQFDLNALTSTAQTFSYLSYSRAGGISAVVLGETQIHGLDYYIVTVFRQSNRSYSAGLVLKSACTAVDPNEYAAAPENFDQNVGYITNQVLLYKYPYLTQTLHITTLAKNASVTVLKELSLGDTFIDYDYYYIGYLDGQGNMLYGYVPKRFVRNFNGLSSQNSAVSFKTLLPTKDITATDANGNSLILKAGEKYEVTAYMQNAENSDMALISYQKDGVYYYANVSAQSFEQSTASPLRIFLIILLLVLDVAIAVNYLVYRKKD